MILDFKRLSRFAELLYMLAWRDIRVRYKQSIMGFLWAILAPTLLISAGIMFRIVLANYTQTKLTVEDTFSLTIRAVIWVFFTGALRVGAQSLIGNSSLVTKISFQREVLPLSAILSSLFDFLVATCTITIILLAFGWKPTYHAVWAPLLFLVLLALVTGFTLLFSAINLFFRDVKYIVDVVLTYAVFITPVFFEASFAGKWEGFIMLNPVAPILEGMSSALFSNRAPDLFWTGYSIVTASLVLIIGYRVFKGLESRFAESI